jgi:hypothetical protein
MKSRSSMLFAALALPDIGNRSDKNNWSPRQAPTNVAGFILQSTKNLVSPSVWNTNLPAPVVVNEPNTVTNAISGARKFYRLSQ